MRYFLLVVALTVVAVISIAGFRGEITQRTPFEIFPDMDRQAKVLPQTRSEFYADGRASRKPVEGTVARSERFEDSPVNTGRMQGSTNFVETIPVPVTASLMEKGQKHYGIYCAPCHGETGAGNGITTQFGMTVIGDLHDYTTRQMVRKPDGELYDTITNGKGLMGGYGSKLSIEERWAVVAYVRALQWSQLATTNEVPQSELSNLQ